MLAFPSRGSVDRAKPWKSKSQLVPNTAEAITELDIREEDVERTVSPELADELRYAPLANLKGHAVSEQAIALVQHLAHKVSTWSPGGHQNHASEQTAQAGAELPARRRGLPCGVIGSTRRGGGTRMAPAVLEQGEL